jgi:hypothetical protein
VRGAIDLGEARVDELLHECLRQRLVDGEVQGTFGCSRLLLDLLRACSVRQQRD